jgi:hypothetical protein
MRKGRYLPCPIVTDYLEKNCKKILSRKITKTQWRNQGGKSRKKAGGMYKKL